MKNFSWDCKDEQMNFQWKVSTPALIRRWENYWNHSTKHCENRFMLFFQTRVYWRYCQVRPRTTTDSSFKRVCPRLFGLRSRKTSLVPQYSHRPTKGERFKPFSLFLLYWTVLLAPSLWVEIDQTLRQERIISPVWLPANGNGKSSSDLHDQFLLHLHHVLDLYSKCRKFRSVHLSLHWITFCWTTVAVGDDQSSILQICIEESFRRSNNCSFSVGVW